MINLSVGIPFQKMNSGLEKALVKNFAITKPDLLRELRFPGEKSFKFSKTKKAYSAANLSNYSVKLSPKKKTMPCNSSLLTGNFAGHKSTSERRFWSQPLKQNSLHETIISSVEIRLLYEETRSFL